MIQPPGGCPLQALSRSKGRKPTHQTAEQKMRKHSVVAIGTGRRGQMKAIGTGFGARGLRALVLSMCLALGLGLAGVWATQARGQAYPYTLVDPGMLGGSQSFANLPAVPVTANGTVLGTADTSTPDSDFPNFNPFMVGFPDPYVAHAFAWRDGQLRDLGALPGNNSSSVFEVNGAGVGVGASETSTYDPNTGWPADHAVMYVHGQVKDLGTLPGGFESQANDINDQGLVSGFASNGVPDPNGYSSLGPSPFGGSNFADWGTQARSFIWQNGVMTDVGTLGGPDAVSQTLNDRGQITGASYTNSTPNADTGVPTLDPFLWQNGHMRDLGSLGGDLSISNWLNNRGEVVGWSWLAGDQVFHPFLWNGSRMVDLGTLGGSVGQANYINDAGAVVGWATTPGDVTAHAFLSKGGTITDLTGADTSQCTIAIAVNAGGQVVGSTCDESDALLWANGKQYDLNALVAPSPLQLTAAPYVDARGDIVAKGFLPDGSSRLLLLLRNSSVPLPATSTAASPLRTAHQTELPGSRLLPLRLGHLGAFAQADIRRLLDRTR
jgi:probable HAF family extracellular repeat protein